MPACLVLLLANMLRVAFWFGHPFDAGLLVQSLVMIAGMLAMMHLCVRVHSLGGPKAKRLGHHDWRPLTPTATAKPQCQGKSVGHAKSISARGQLHPGGAHLGLIWRGNPQQTNRTQTQ